MRITEHLNVFKKQAKHIIEIATTADGDEWRDDIPRDLLIAFELIDDIIDEF